MDSDYLDACGVDSRHCARQPPLSAFSCGCLIFFLAQSNALKSCLTSVTSFLRSNIDPYAIDHHAKVLSNRDVTCCLCASESTSEEHKLTIAKGGLFIRS